MKKYPLIKQTLILLLTGVYFFAANGLIIQKLFCDGALTHVSFSLTGEGRCSQCPTDKNCEDNCCHSKIVFQKLNDSQKTSRAIKISQPRLIAFFNFIPEYLLGTNENTSQKSFSSFASPPLIIHEPVFLINRSILI
ncbi:MAG TPA: hypothetical protein VJY62_12025 [Bacteroidia bacterium]|nr:hypothetical protein [Bacteroidia bacterium]